MPDGRGRFPLKMAEKTVLISQQLLKPIKISKWKVSVGNSMSIGSVILLYDFEGALKPEQRKLKSTQAGTVHELIAPEGAIIKPGGSLLKLRACIHPTVMKDMCAECGADLRIEETITTASVPMVHSIPDLKVSEELAQKLGRADGERLLRDRKLVLLVDLDQTLIHTTNDNIPANIKDVYHFQLYGPNSPWYHTRLRPGTHEFLSNVSPMFELHICTFGARNYAHMITMFLDGDQRFFSNRILSRDECFDPTSKKANLKALFPCGDNMVCIIDDREDVWNHASNLIHVKPYHFFQHTGDINAPPGLDKQENDEKEGVDLSKLKTKPNKPNGKNVKEDTNGVDTSKTNGEEVKQNHVKDEQDENMEIELTGTQVKVAATVEEKHEKMEIKLTGTEVKVAATVEEKHDEKMEIKLTGTEVKVAATVEEKHDEKMEIKLTGTEVKVAATVEEKHDEKMEIEHTETEEKVALSNEKKPVEKMEEDVIDTTEEKKVEEEVHDNKTDGEILDKKSQDEIIEKKHEEQILDVKNEVKIIKKNEQKMVEVNNEEKMIDTKIVDVKNEEKAIDMKIVHMKNEEKAIDTKIVEVKNEEKTIDIKTVDVKIEEKPVDMKIVHVKNEETPIDMKMVDVKNEEKAIDTKIVDVKNEENPIDTKIVDVKNEEKPIDTKIVDVKSISKILDRKKEKKNLDLENKKEEKTVDGVIDMRKEVPQNKEIPSDEKIEVAKEPVTLMNTEEKNGKVEHSKEDDLIEIEDPDDYLLHLEDILKRIHLTFYEEYDKLESGEVPDLKRVIPTVRSEILKGTKLVFSGLVPTHIKLQQSKAYQVARSLGALVTQDLDGESTHLVAVRPGTAKVNAGRRKRNLKIVTPDWLWSCAERWEHVDEAIYPLNSKGSKNRHPPPHCSSPEHVPNYPVHEAPGARKRTPSGRFMDTINPLMSFSSDDIADMDKEVEDILDDESDESEEESQKEVPEQEKPPPNPPIQDEESSSSSGESLTGEYPRGFKRTREKRKLESLNNVEDDQIESSLDEFPSTKFRRGEQLDSDLDIGQESNSEGSVDAPDEVDDGEWNMMGAALEREFLSNN